ncbi:Tyrosine-protein kinase ptk [Rosistilla carotiformis]|uniref:non-specific protein-tyrosine kinase n=2 Tax=Rosistilla carotiformis TaxID=2528017 RepID=A0A518JLD2_9BACT|nr:Tyrosine-protein kinase ptk [Rosistilla carotiformis]
MQIDWVKLIWGGRWLLLLGLLVGLGAGYFHFKTLPPEFLSSSDVQIIESTTNKNMAVDGVEVAASRSLADEALVMRSEFILRRAAELPEIVESAEFAGLGPEQIAGLMGGRALTIGPATEESNSVFRVQFVSDSPVISKLVVQALVDAYGLHLQDQYRNVSQETLDLIESAQKDVSKKLTALEEDYAKFKTSSNLIYHDDKIASVHRENSGVYLSQIQSLTLERAKLNSVMDSAKLAISEEKPLESVLMSLRNLAVDDSKQDLANDAVALKMSSIERKRIVDQLRTSARIREEKLLPLEIERKKLSRSFGSGHVAIKSLDEEIQVVKRLILDAVQTEERSIAELESAWAELDELASNQPTTNPEDELRRQVRLVFDSMTQKLQSVEQEIGEIQTAYHTAVEAAKAESIAESRSEQYVREIERQQQLYDRIVARLDEVNLISEGEGLKVIPLNTANYGYQIAPVMLKSLVMGGFLGTVLAFGLAFLREISDRSYRSPQEVSEHTGLPVIGHIPVLKRWKVDADHVGAALDSRLCTFFQRKGMNSEAFRALRTAVFFSNQSGDNQILQITSATPSDGKTTTAGNLAITMAQAGKSVLILDADLRRPRIAKLFDLRADKGLAWAIEQITLSKEIDDLMINEAIQDTVVPNLSAMVAGNPPDNPSELVTSEAFEQILSALRVKFDLIIIDTPPMLAVSDPSNVVRRADGVILVARLRKNVKPVVAQASRMLETLEANVLGIVINGVGSREAGAYGKSSGREGYYNQGEYYKYGYGYSYGAIANDSSREYYEVEAPKQAAPVQQTQHVPSACGADLTNHTS